MATVHERYSENLDALEESLLGEKESVLAQEQSVSSRSLRRYSARNAGDEDPATTESAGAADFGGCDSGDELEDPQRLHTGHDEAPTRPKRDKATRAPSAKTRKYQSTHHTGIKGILADYHNAKDLDLHAKRRSSTAGARMRVVAAPTSLNAAGAHRRDLLLGGSSSDEDEDFAMDEDDPEFAAYREERRAQMAVLVKTHSTVKEVDSDGLLDAVMGASPFGCGRGSKNQSESSSSQDVVLVHVYDEHVPICQIVNHRLDVLSAQPDHQRRVRFLKIKAKHVAPDAAGRGQGFDSIMYPAFNVYQTGDEKPVHTLVAVTRETGPRPTAADLEKYFVAKGVLVLPLVRSESAQ